VNGEAKQEFVEKGNGPGFIQHVSAMHSSGVRRDRVLLPIVRAEWGATKQGM
jgi:hypothetical protein